MTERRLARHLTLGLLVLAGLAFGHDLVFRLAAGAASDRAHLLVETGHMAWTPTRTTATVLAVGFVLLAAPSRRRVDAGRLPSAYARVVGRLAFVQTVGFVAIEIGERLAHGAPLAELAHDPILAHGILVQLAVGLLGGLLLVAVHGLLTHLPRRARPDVPQTVRPAGVRRRAPRPQRLLVPGTGPRAPPCVA